MEKIPLYHAVPGEGYLEFVSLVDQPAIIEKGLAFAQELRFQAVEDKGIIVGPAMIPDVIMSRYDKETGEYAIVFSKESIEWFQEEFNRSAKDNKVNFDHNAVVPSAFIKSNWIVEDDKNDKMNMYGLSYPVGTWMMEVKVTDKDWFARYVKEEGRYGFSVEGLFQLERKGSVNKNEMIKMSKEKLTAETLKLMLAELSPEEVQLIQDAIADVVAEPEVVAEVTDSVAEVINELMPEEVKEEVKEEELQEEIPVDVPVVDNEVIIAKVMEEIAPKMDEIYAMIAELKNEMGKQSPSEEVVENVEVMSAFERKMTGMRHLAMSGLNIAY